MSQMNDGRLISAWWPVIAAAVVTAANLASMLLNDDIN